MLGQAAAAGQQCICIVTLRDTAHCAAIPNDLTVHWTELCRIDERCSCGLAGLAGLAIVRRKNLANCRVGGVSECSGVTWDSGRELRHTPLRQGGSQPAEHLHTVAVLGCWVGKYLSGQDWPFGTPYYLVSVVSTTANVKLVISSSKLVHIQATDTAVGSGKCNSGSITLFGHRSFNHFAMYISYWRLDIVFK